MNNPILQHSSSSTQTEESQTRNHVGEVVSDLWTAVKKTPGNIVGGGVDLVNLISGVAIGAGTKGLVEEPVGGSRWINKKFGMDKTGKETIVQEVSEFLGSMANPSSASKAMIVGLPLAMRTGWQMEKFSEMEKAGASAKEMFDTTGIWAGKKDKLLRTATSDKLAFVKVSGLETLQDGSPGIRFVPQMKSTKVSDIFGGEVLRQYPELGDIKIDIMAGKPGEAAFSADKNTIFLAPAGVSEIQTALLHELQHAVQKKEGFTRGSSVLGAMDPTTRKQYDRYGELLKDPRFKAETERIQSRRKAAYDKGSKDYLNVPGEQEARFTELTQDFDQTQLNSYISTLLERDADPQSWRKLQDNPITGK